MVLAKDYATQKVFANEYLNGDNGINFFTSKLNIMFLSIYFKFSFESLHTIKTFGKLKFLFIIISSILGIIFNT